MKLLGYIKQLLSVVALFIAPFRVWDRTEWK